MFPWDEFKLIPNKRTRDKKKTLQNYPLGWGAGCIANEKFNFPLFFAVPNFFADFFCFVDISISSRVWWLSRCQDKIEAPSKKGTHTKWGRNLTSESDLEKWKTSLCRARRSSQAWRTSFRVCRTISPLRRSTLTTGPSNYFTRWQVAEIQLAGLASVPY